MENQPLIDGSEPSLDEARAEYTRLKREHGELETRLDDLKQRVYLSAAEEVEKKTLQKLKLAKKDRIVELERQLGEPSGE
jgi:uncharacterized protein YdcH (DUF465 family)